LTKYKEHLKKGDHHKDRTDGSTQEKAEILFHTSTNYSQGTLMEYRVFVRKWYSYCRKDPSGEYEMWISGKSSARTSNSVR
jgi:hypothetical protein